MLTIMCIAIICFGVCYTGFHTWTLLGEFRSDRNDGHVVQPVRSTAHTAQPVEQNYLFGLLTRPLSELLPESRQRRLLQSEQLEAAGFYSRSAWCNFNAVRVVLTFFTVIAVLGGMILAPLQWNLHLFALLILAPITVWALPGLWLACRASQRTAEVERGLPDLLDILNMGVSQGLPMPSILFRIAPEIQEAHPALAQELSMIRQQSHVCTMDHGLEEFAQRFDSEAIRSFSSLLIQSQATGTSLSKALQEYSDNFRAVLRQRIDTRANEASFKLLFPTTLCLLPAVFLFLLGPAIVDIADFLDNSANTAASTTAQKLPSTNQSKIVVPLGN